MAQPRGARARDGVTLREARAEYFAANGFGEEGYQDRWVRLMAGPIPIYFPNSAERVRALRRHDLHHPLAGYDTTWTGEAEIGAWELASGCVAFPIAFLLNLFAMAVGLALDPWALWRAFLRGRHTANLYGYPFDDALLERNVADVRRELGLDRPLATIRAAWADRVLFVGWSLASLLVLTALSAAWIVPIGLLLFWWAGR